MCLFSRDLVFLYFCVGLDHFAFLLFDFFVFSYSILSREIGSDERLQKELFCFQWDVKRQLGKSINSRVRIMVGLMLCSLACMCMCAASAAGSEAAVAAALCERSRDRGE